MPEWPPKDADYSKKLQEKKIRVINKEEFRMVEELDGKGFSKVMELPGYKGVFKNSKVRVENC